MPGVHIGALAVAHRLPDHTPFAEGAAESGVQVRLSDVSAMRKDVGYEPEAEMRRRAEAPTSSLLKRLNLAGPPSFFEPRLERAVEAQERVPSFAGDGLHPIVLFANRRLGPEIDVH